MFYYNPTAKDENGVRKKLRKLHTEGQTLVGTRKQYGSLSVCIPLGIAFKYTVNKKLSLALEYGIRYTFTDYIDDVSKTYVDKDLLAKQPNGQLAVKMANRTPNTPGNEHITAPGAQRGNPKYNDAYMFGIFSLNYKLKTTKTNLPKF